MSRPLTVTFDPDEVAKMPPQIQEALWRLAVKDQPVQDPRTPNQRLRESFKTVETQAQWEARRDKNMNPDGSINSDIELKPPR